MTLRPREQHGRCKRPAPAGDDGVEGRVRSASGVEGTLSQGVRGFGLRHCRYIGLVKVHLQHVATAAAINIYRISDWLGNVPHAATRTSRFARLAA